MKQTFPAKTVGVSKLYDFDFTSQLGVGETISTQSVQASVYTGNDPTPQNIVSGAATASGAVVSQLITAGVVGTIYSLLCTITTSLGQTLQLQGFLAISQVDV